MSHFLGDPSHSLESGTPAEGGCSPAAPPAQRPASLAPGTTGEAPSSPASAAAADQILHQGEHTRVFRRTVPGSTAMVICKEFLGSKGPSRLRHEQCILERLGKIEGVPRLAQGYRLPGALVMEDLGGRPLLRVLSAGEIEAPLLIELALQMTGILARLHAAGVAHRNLTPAQLICDPSLMKLTLVDFSLATTFAEERPAFVHHREIVGALPYLAPEQTGRTGWPVDQRTDLYALGVTLYQLATGSLPFQHNDPLQLIHDILARIPSPPLDLAPRLPRGLSAIIMRLIEKEPGRRYQSAEGLAWDLKLLAESVSRGSGGAFPLGRRDFPLRLSAPSRLVGRSRELRTLMKGFEAACRGESAAVFLAGAPGVGKSALINEVRPSVTARRGFFAPGKFDSLRHDLPADAIIQALQTLASLLLAEPEQELTLIRERILTSVGSNAGLVAGMEPRFALLLKVAPERLAGDPLKDKDRLTQTAVDLLRGIASPERPVVLALENLQWAPPAALAFLDGVLTRGVPGLLLVGSYREREAAEREPVAAHLARWQRLEPAPQLVRMGNLGDADLCRLLQEMLRLEEGEAASLAGAMAEMTGGNPYSAVEMVNALRRDGLLQAGEHGWSWDPAAVRRYVGRGGVVELLSERIGRLPAPTREVLTVMACVGGTVSRTLLQRACGCRPEELEALLLPALEDGVVFADQQGLRLKHERVQQVACGRLAAGEREARCLAIARRLAEFPDCQAAASELYLCCYGSLSDPGECQTVAALFRSAASQYRLVNPALAERYLAAAMELLRWDGPAVEDPLLARVEIERHAALYALGSLELADRLFARVQSRSLPPLELADAACVQMSSLLNRGRYREAAGLGLPLLRELGVAVPEQSWLESKLEPQLALFCRLVQQEDWAQLLDRPEMTDPEARAAVSIINSVMPAVFFYSRELMAWMVLESHRLWVEKGACAQLVAPICHIGMLSVARRDYHTGHRVMQALLGAGAARGYHAETAQGRFLFAIHALPWCEPVEESVRQSRLAREGLMRAGELQFACFTYLATVSAMLDCAPALEEYCAELEEALAFAKRTGNEFMAISLVSTRQLLAVLTGEHSAAGSFADPAFDERAHLAILQGNPVAIAAYHFHRALAAALFADVDTALRYTAQAVPLMSFIEANYVMGQVQLLNALTLCWQCRTASEKELQELLARLAACREWLAQRAAEAPANFLHLLHFTDAEAAWAAGDFRAALSFFDAALGSADAKRRRWHRALIAERAGLFHLAHGLTQGGGKLLVEARDLYRDWGAKEKVRQLEEAHPLLRESRRMADEDACHSVSGDTVDLLAVLRASQALSSQTGLDRLRARVVEVLCSLTGATSVTLVIWQDQSRQWSLVPPEGSGRRSSPLPVSEAASAGLLPLSLFRYVERTRVPLLVANAADDDRFLDDPYLAGPAPCSLLAVPILNQGELRAVLMLENRLSQGAFTADGLDTVTLIAGQLAVSLENALLYQKLEERVRERTAALEAAQHELVAAARQAGMAEIATNVLHNVGNVLNSVNISAELVSARVRHSKTPRLLMAVRLIKEHEHDLAAFLGADEKGRLLPNYLEKLAEALLEEQKDVVEELSQLSRCVDHIKEVVATQQCYAGALSLVEQVELRELVEDALRINQSGLARHQVAVEKRFAGGMLLPLDKGRVLQILVNLISNARHAMEGVAVESRTLVISAETGRGLVRISVADRGVGITAGNLERIFTHGFTTKKDGHGFGLHSCAVAAREMGGNLKVESAGAGQGATFTLELPIAKAGETT